MSLKPSPIQPVPEETARVARAAFRKGNHSLAASSWPPQNAYGGGER